MKTMSKQTEYGETESEGSYHSGDKPTAVAICCEITRGSRGPV
jgi:hypothetical protein